MRIRKSSFTSSPASNSSASCSSSPLSSISYSSSIAAAATHLSSSSTDSSSSYYPTSSNLATKCQGLNLLVKAIHLVTAGSVVGVPYIQRRIVRRRRRISEIDRLFMSQLTSFHQESENTGNVKTRSMMRRQKKPDSLLPSLNRHAGI